MKNCGFGLIVLSCVCLAETASGDVQTPFTPIQTSISAEEDASRALINRFRADPQGEIGRLLKNTNWTNGIQASSNPTANNGTTHSSNFWQSLAGQGSSAKEIASAMDYWRVSPGDLKKQNQQLPASGTLMPLNWATGLLSSAEQYNRLLIQDDGATSNPHEVAPYSPFSVDRFVDAGFRGPARVSENIFRGWPTGYGIDYTHAGFVIDWGYGPGGIQSPAGHRDNMVSEDVTQIGIDNRDPLAENPGGSFFKQGQDSLVQHFGSKWSDRDVFGYLWEDADGDEKYDWGEGFANTTVTLFDAETMKTLDSVESNEYGGYHIDLAQIGGLSTGQTLALGMEGSDQLAEFEFRNTRQFAASVQLQIPEPSGAALASLAGLIGGLRRKRGNTSLA